MSSGIKCEAIVVQFLKPISLVKVLLFVLFNLNTLRLKMLCFGLLIVKTIEILFTIWFFPFDFYLRHLFINPPNQQTVNSKTS